SPGPETGSSWHRRTPGRRRSRRPARAGPARGTRSGPRPPGPNCPDRTGSFSRASWFRNFPSKPGSAGEFGARALLSQSSHHWKQKRKKPEGRSENPEGPGVSGEGEGGEGGKPPSPGFRAQAADEALPFLVEALHVELAEGGLVGLVGVQALVESAEVGHE